MLEERIAEWRAYLGRRQAIRAMDVEELEDHLRNLVSDLGAAGLDEEEAFLIAVKRIGDLDSLSQEYAREYSERLWKRLVVTPGTDGGEWNREAMVALSAACLGGHGMLRDPREAARWAEAARANQLPGPGAR